jgi:hypothetical protein
MNVGIMEVAFADADGNGAGVFCRAERFSTSQTAKSRAGVVSSLPPTLPVLSDKPASPFHHRAACECPFGLYESFTAALLPVPKNPQPFGQLVEDGLDAFIQPVAQFITNAILGLSLSARGSLARVAPSTLATINADLAVGVPFAGACDREWRGDKDRQGGDDEDCKSRDHRTDGGN